VAPFARRSAAEACFHEPYRSGRAVICWLVTFPCEVRATSTAAVELPSPDAADEATLGRATMRKVARRLLPFLFLLYVVNFLDRTNVSFAALGMNRDLGFSATTYGLGAGLFFAGYVLCQMPANLMLVRVGPRRWVAGILIAWGIIAGCLSLIRTPGEFYLLRVLLGVAEAGFFPAMIVYLTQWFPAAERARAVGRFMLAIPISGIIGGPLSGALLGLDGIAGLAGWRWLFVLEALPAIGLGFVTLHYLTERPALAAWLEPAERSWLEAALAAEQRTSGERSEVTLLGMLSNRVVWVLASIAFLGNTGAYGITFWLPQVLAAETARSSFVVGVLTVIPQLVVVGAVLAVSTHSDRTGERCLHAGIPFLVAGLGLMIAAPAYSLPVTLLGMSLGLAGYGAGSYGPFWSLPCSFLRGAAAAAGIAFINSVGNLGGLVGPYLLGAVKDRTGGY